MQRADLRTQWGKERAQMERGALAYRPSRVRQTASGRALCGTGLGPALSRLGGGGKGRGRDIYI